MGKPDSGQPTLTVGRAMKILKAIKDSAESKLLRRRAEKLIQDIVEFQESAHPETATTTSK